MNYQYHVGTKSKAQYLRIKNILRIKGYIHSLLSTEEHSIMSVHRKGKKEVIIFYFLH